MNHLLTLKGHRFGGVAGEEGAISEASLQEEAAFSLSSMQYAATLPWAGSAPEAEPSSLKRQSWSPGAAAAL